MTNSADPDQLASFIMFNYLKNDCDNLLRTLNLRHSLYVSSKLKYEGMSINNQPIPFPMDRDGHDFHALFQYMIYTLVQNYTSIESVL